MDTSLKNKLSNFLNIENIVLAGRGALGIYAALRVWNSKGKIAVPSAVCQDVIAAIYMAGWIPIFCDVQKETGLTSKEEWLRARNAGASAAIVVHLYGNAANTFIVKKIFSDGLVIDDAAQALAARTSVNSFYAGTIGDIGIISFGNSKQIQVGGAALLFHDKNFAKACEAVLGQLLPATLEQTKSAQSRFRVNLNLAITDLRVSNDNTKFRGLLDGYSPALHMNWKSDWSQDILQALKEFPSKMELRRDKVLGWKKVIEGTGLIPVGMDTYSSPWRFCCRLPGCDWKRQQTLGDLLRLNGLSVSHWYLPSHWYASKNKEILAGTETLSQECFQFWIDESIDISTILNFQKTIHSIFASA